MSQLLASVGSFSKSELRKTTTRLTTRTGHVFEESLGAGDGQYAKQLIGVGPVPQYLEDASLGISRLTCKTFCEQKGDWVPAAAGSVERSGAGDRGGISAERIKFVSYNVWFSEVNWVNRADALFAEVFAENPDIICLQEVTPKFLRKLLQHPFVQQSYCVSDSTGATVVPYGVVMLSKFELKELELHDLPSGMGRRYLQAEIVINGHAAKVGTAHLESLDSTDIRIQQVQRIAQITSGDDIVFVCGDFNFHSAMTENNVIGDFGFCDSWAAIHADSVLSRRGRMIDRFFHKNRARADLSVAAPGIEFVATSMRLIGTEAMGTSIPVELEKLEGHGEREGDAARYPSDHDGLCAEFAVRASPQECLRFGVVADPQYIDAENGSNFDGSVVRRYRQSKTILEEAVRYFQQVSPAFGVILGDAIDARARTLRMEVTCLEEILECTSRHAVDWHILLGNHDLSCLSREYLLQRFIPASSRPRCCASKMYYDFEAEGFPQFRFVVLDGYDVSTISPSQPADAATAAAMLMEKNPNLEQDENGSFRSTKSWFEGISSDCFKFVPYNGAIGDTQLDWLRGVLSNASSLGQKSFVFCHEGCHPGSCRPDALLWNYEEVLGVLHAHADTVAAFICGHDHVGGYFLDSAGIHHIVPPAPLECEEGEVAFGHFALHADHFVLHWTGKVPASADYHEWPAGKQLFYSSRQSPAL